ncbi:MAG: VWA domain-containing protein [Gammaproteobacteria bacterium]|nr:VWA domain-containing protein [Gammaproteobacteria bacterium]
MSNRYFHLFVFLVYLLSFSQTVPAAGLEAADSDSRPVQLRAVDFTLELHGVYAAGVMEAELIAAYGKNNAANFRFPLPPGAVLHKAELFAPAEETWIAAETVGRREGKNIYDQIVQQDFDPLLIQQIGKDFYRARIFPVNVDSTYRLRVSYAHILEKNEHGHRLRIALANPDSTAATPARGVGISVIGNEGEWESGAWRIGDEFAHPGTVNMQSGSVHIELRELTLDQDVKLDLQAAETLPDSSALYYRPPEDSLQGHLHAWWLPDFSEYPELSLIQPRNIVFVLDVSGSMGGAKITQARIALTRSLESLDSRDYFGLVEFDSEVNWFHSEMLPAASLGEAKQWVENRRAGSTTNIAGGLIQAAKIGATSPLSGVPADILLITDGRPNVGSTTTDDILKDIGMQAEQIARNIRISAVGIGSDLDQELLNGLSRETGGEAVFALDDSEITGDVLSLVDRIRGGGVDNARLTVSGEGLTSEEYMLPRLFSGNSLQAAATGILNETLMLTLKGGMDSSSLELNSVPALLNAGTAFSRIAAPLAAKIRADRLERQIDLNGETAESVDQAVRLARVYGIVTRYSSMLALESEALYEEHGMQRIQRNEAGIALEEVSGAIVDEDRVGGEGTQEASTNDSFSPVLSMPMPNPPVVYDASDSLSSFSYDSIGLSNGGYSPSASVSYYSDFNSPPSSGGYLSSGSSYPYNSSVVGGYSSSVSAPYEPEPPSCGDTAMLDDKGFLYIPYLRVADKEFWATLHLVENPREAEFVLWAYGYLSDGIPYYCQEAELNNAQELSIPKVTFADINIYNVNMQGAWTDDLRFTQVQYRLSSID